MGTERLLFVIEDLYIFEYKLINSIIPKVYELTSKNTTIIELL
jgi:hypothetical protein